MNGLVFQFNLYEKWAAQKNLLKQKFGDYEFC